MIIGRGDIAKVIKDREGFTFYCNGVSNRLPLTEEAKENEWYDVIQPSDNMFVYISTLSIYYSDSEYTKHKLRMEERVKNCYDNYCILRIGNITWGDNPNTLWNYLKRDQSRIEDTYRYLINKNELNHWINLIPKTGKHEMNITGLRTSVDIIANNLKHDFPFTYILSQE